MTDEHAGLTQIYGHAVDLTEPPGMVTDVVVIARSVRYDEDGIARGDVLVSHTRQTDAVLLRGIRESFNEWLDLYLEETSDMTDYSDLDDDEDEDEE